MIEYTENDFNIEELGSFYSKHKTVFKVFAPESRGMILVLNDKKYPMNKDGFSYEVVVEGDHHLGKYYYINDKGVSFRDPFSYFSDDKYSYVLDTTKFIKKVIIPKKENNIIIYETSVRDFSCDDNFKGKQKRKLLGLIEPGLVLNDNTIGLDYIKELGITHLQLMPVLDFSLAGKDYNWGYNPIAFNYLYNGYIDDADNPYANANELREVVNILHDNNIRVTLDVVFNHAYKIHEFDLHKMIPGHVFRLKDNGSYAKGTLCGNEIKTEDPFMRAYFVEMVKRYIRLYDIDGIRIDQMGAGDYETVNLIYFEAIKLKRDFIVYGEGWNMGDALPEDMRATIINGDKINRIGMFNDYFRNTITNYICGDKRNREDVKNVLCGTHDSLNYSQSLNYVECHDNLTFYDRLVKYNICKNNKDVINKCKLALGIVMVSRGIPFIHSGQEFLRTKSLCENSYNRSEKINKLDWNRRVENKEICDFLKELIKIRKGTSAFVKRNPNISLSNYKECIVYAIDDLKIFINASRKNYSYNDGNRYEVILDSYNKNCYFNDTIFIKPNSIVIVK